MKKIIKVLSIITLVIVLSLSVSACNLPDFFGTFIPPNTGGTLTTQTATLPIRESVDDEGRQLLSKIEANKATERTVVEIMVSEDGVNASSGSGVLVDITTDNSQTQNVVYVITCHHVVDSEGAYIRVLIPDLNGDYGDYDFVFEGVIGGAKENYKQAVALVGGDMQSDLALLRINLDVEAYSGNKLDRAKVQTAIIAPDDYQIQQGEDVIAIGNPKGLYPGWLTDGIVSLVETEAEVDTIGTMKLIGINAPTNHGNSGGGLFNMYGELIGITNAGSSNDAQCINFAIPLYTSDKDVDGVIDNGVINIITNLVLNETETNYGYVTNRNVRFGFTVNNQSGTAVLSEVISGSLAAQAGFKAGDVVVSYSVNGGLTQTNVTFDSLISCLDSLTIGDVISFKVSRTVPGVLGGVQKETHDLSLTVYQFLFCDTGK